ncbi:MAG: L-asparaginase 1, partial [Muribaculaceae bacterium]|nr:L-asparaginase 1 [Muribaculaceae bacterium]
SADNFNAFKSNNYPSLAKIGLGIHFNEEALWRVQAKRPLKVQYELDTAVMFLDLNPGITEAVLRHQLSTPGIKGIVLKTFGAGNAPTYAWFTEAVKEAVERDIVILNVTQCVNGGVHAKMYMSGNQLASTGVVSGHDITSEAAITKMMYLFGLGLSTAEVRRYLECSLCGEVSL